MEKKYYYKKNSKQTCFMCDSPAETGDHVPPKGMFATSIRKQKDYKPLLVPACKEHNNFSKLDDEYIRLVFATGSPENDSSKKLFQERILPRAVEEGGSNLLRMIYEKMTPTLLPRPSGILTIGYKFEIDKPRLQNIVEKIIHGIYWHHNGHRVPDAYKISAYSYNRNIPVSQKIVLCRYPLFFLGHPSVFEYRYVEIDNDKNKVYLAMLIFESLLIETTIVPEMCLQKQTTNHASAPEPPA